MPKRTRTQTTRNPRLGKRLCRDPETPTGRQTPAAESNDENDAPQLPSIRADMSRDELYEAARRYEADRAESQRTRREEQRNVLAEVTNVLSGSGKAGDEKDKAAEDDLRFIQEFVATFMLWLPAGWEEEVWKAKEDEDFSVLDRFGKDEQPFNKIQGALADIYAVIPEEYRDPEDFKGWIPAASHGLQFTSGMNDQRSFTVTRLRHHPDLWDCTTAQLSSQQERRQFRDLIGYRVKSKKPNEYYYDTMNVPVLHADYQGKHDPRKIFLGPLLFIVHAAITLGPVAAAAIKANRVPPKLRWILSVDETFLPTGSVSAIEWQADFEFYLQILTEGLLKKKPSILNIFRVWDNKFYPNSDESLAGGVDSRSKRASRRGVQRVSSGPWTALWWGIESGVRSGLVHAYRVFVAGPVWRKERGRR
ncbi:hypothetical protein DFH07DRAFT_785663 [Mycena maculata]|uniref:Uncharacterized protein n=1 Tax=Mycena maculata TaxID=230809 RepID=A0AAD7MFY4_9AGAR|nr:hypothetical protein DFH07DRAFT_785663 [Mycena maculata]